MYKGTGVFRPIARARSSRCAAARRTGEVGNAVRHHVYGRCHLQLSSGADGSKTSARPALRRRKLPVVVARRCRRCRRGLQSRSPPTSECCWRARGGAAIMIVGRANGAMPGGEEGDARAAERKARWRTEARAGKVAPGVGGGSSEANRPRASKERKMPYAVRSWVWLPAAKYSAI